MPTIKAASTPSRSVTMNACNMATSAPLDFENEFQFQLYKDSRLRREASTREITRACDLNHVEEATGAAESAGPLPVAETTSPRPGIRRRGRSGGCRLASTGAAGAA